MAHRKSFMIIAAVLLLVVISGCSGNSREESAQLRWQRTLDQARLQAAQKGFEEGRLTYAQRILRECDRCFDPQSPLAGQAKQLLVKIEDEQNRYTKAASEI